MLAACSPGAASAPSSGEGGVGANTSSSNEGKLRIIATTFAPFDFARQIVGERADVSMLLPPGTESHSFEPTPQDIISIGEADIFIYVGGESDEWVKTVLSSINTSKLAVITLLDCVETKTEDVIEGMEEGATGGTEPAGEPSNEPAAEVDEHVWTSPQNAKLIVERIAAACESADATNAEIYKQNTTAYLAQLDELDAQFKQLVASTERKTLVFGDRFPFRYFVDAYDLDYYAAFPGCSSQTEASAATVAFLVDKVRAEKIPVVLKIELSSGAVAEAIANETNTKVETLGSAHNVTRDDFESGATYLSIMQQNLIVLKEALN
jgi:zinc transport system substrate-binding protein